MSFSVHPPKKRLGVHPLTERRVDQSQNRPLQRLTLAKTVTRLLHMHTYIYADGFTTLGCLNILLLLCFCNRILPQRRRLLVVVEREQEAEERKRWNNCVTDILMLLVLFFNSSIVSSSGPFFFCGAAESFI